MLTESVTGSSVICKTAWNQKKISAVISLNCIGVSGGEARKSPQLRRLLCPAQNINTITHQSNYHLTAKHQLCILLSEAFVTVYNLINSHFPCKSENWLDGGAKGKLAGFSSDVDHEYS